MDGSGQRVFVDSLITKYPEGCEIPQRDNLSLLFI